MQIDIAHLAKLSRLRIEREEMPHFEKDMQAIVAMVENLPETNGELGVDTEHPMELRRDEARPSIPREDVLKNAPKTQAGCIVVPKVIE